MDERGLAGRIDRPRHGRRWGAVGLGVAVLSAGLVLASLEGARADTADVRYDCGALGTVALPLDSTPATEGGWIGGSVSVAYRLALPALPEGESVTAAGLDTPAVTFSDYHAVRGELTVTTDGGTFGTVTTAVDVAGAHVDATAPAPDSPPALPTVTLTTRWGRMQDNLIGGPHPVTAWWALPALRVTTTTRSISCTPVDDRYLATSDFTVYYGTRYNPGDGSSSSTTPTSPPTATTAPTTIPPTTVGRCGRRPAGANRLWWLLVRLFAPHCR